MGAVGIRVEIPYSLGRRLGQLAINPAQHVKALAVRLTRP